MTSYDLLFDQHRKIIEKLEFIDRIRRSNYDPNEIGKHIAQLSGLIGVHLTMEDKVMYPKLLSHPDEKIRQIARRFKDEMGGLVHAWKEYSSKWMLARNIKDDFSGFNDETDKVFTALRERVRREDNELYPLLSTV